MDRSEILRILGSTPQRVMELALGLSLSELAGRPKEGEWSIGEILNHLLLGERDVILPRLRRIEDAPVFPSSAVSRTGFAANPVPSDFEADLVAFVGVRAETLAFFQALKDPDWDRIGTTPTRGTLTIEAYARYLAEHDIEHLVQLKITRALVKA